MRVLIAAGGTGGHLYPGIALAREFQRRDPQTEILFAGTARALEGEVLHKEGYSLVIVRVEGLIGRGLRRIVRALFLLPLGLVDAYRILNRFKPNLVIGIGGYASGPVLLLAGAVGLPCVVLEPNAIPGFTNRLLSRIGRVELVAAAFEETRMYFRGAVRFVALGNPVRRSLVEEGVGDRAPAGRTLLVLGGSQGARAINTAMVQALERLQERKPDLVIIHQTGRADLERTRRAYESRGVKARVEPYLFRMGEAYQMADLVLCRAGATTIAEITAIGKAAILIPYPYATHAHQLQNALLLGEAGAAVVIEEKDLRGPELADKIIELLQDPDRLRTMAQKSKALGKSDATEKIVDHCLALLG